jgi:hypothetical protein
MLIHASAVRVQIELRALPTPALGPRRFLDADIDF